MGECPKRSALENIDDDSLNAVHETGEHGWICGQTPVLWWMELKEDRRSMITFFAPIFLCCEISSLIKLAPNSADLTRVSAVCCGTLAHSRRRSFIGNLLYSCV